MQNTKYRFMSMYKVSFVVYAVAIVICIASFAIRGLSQSIDFTGGRNYVVTLNKSVPVEDVRPVLQNAFVNTTGSDKGKLATTTVIAIGTDGKTIRVSTNWDIDSNDPNADDKA